MTDRVPGHAVIDKLIGEWTPLHIEFPEIAPGLAQQELDLFKHWLLVHAPQRHTPRVLDVLNVN